MIREKYMAMSHQSFPKITARFLQNLEDNEEFQGMKEGFGKGSTGKQLQLFFFLISFPEIRLFFSDYWITIMYIVVVKSF